MQAPFSLTKELGACAETIKYFMLKHFEIDALAQKLAENMEKFFPIVILQKHQLQDKVLLGVKNLFMLLFLHP